MLLTGATGGIGHAIARAFAARGATLILTGRRADVLEPLAKEVGGEALACDLADRAEVERLAAAAVDANVDVLVANAGLPAMGLMTDLTLADVDRMLEVNLRAPIALAHALAPGMIARRRGHMVFMSSLSGKVTAPRSSMYSATKFGLRGFALGLREDLRAHDVGVSAIFPGFISDAGMFVQAGSPALPLGITTRSPEQVAGAVIRSIERNRAEVDVAPLSLRFGATFAGVAPQIAATFSRIAGSSKIATEMAENQGKQR